MNAQTKSYITNLWRKMMTAQGDDNWIKLALILTATFAGTALISFMVYSVPKLNEISAGQAAILSTLTAQGKYQTAQDEINKEQALTNQKVAENIVEIQTAISLNRVAIKEHEKSDKLTYARIGSETRIEH
jgi:hypothetical protein